MLGAKRGPELPAQQADHLRHRHRPHPARRHPHRVLHGCPRRQGTRDPQGAPSGLRSRRNAGCRAATACCWLGILRPGARLVRQMNRRSSRVHPRDTGSLPTASSSVQVGSIGIRRRRVRAPDAAASAPHLREEQYVFDTSHPRGNWPGVPAHRKAVARRHHGPGRRADRGGVRIEHAERQQEEHDHHDARSTRTARPTTTTAPTIHHDDRRQAPRRRPPSRTPPRRRRPRPPRRPRRPRRPPPRRPAPAASNALGGANDFNTPAAALTGAGSTFDQPLFARQFYDYNKVELQGDGQLRLGRLGNRRDRHSGRFGQLRRLRRARALRRPPAAAAPSCRCPSSSVGSPCLQRAAWATDVHITGTQIAQIYSGTITDWNTIDSGCTTGLAIEPVYRADSSGTSNAFTHYLHSVDPTDWPVEPRRQAAHLPQGRGWERQRRRGR